MNLFRMLLGIFSVVMFGYTAYVGANHGFLILYGIAGTAVQAGGWLGQFTIDLTCYVMLSAIWTAWRNQFSSVGLILGVSVGILGMTIFAPYLLWLTFKTKGDMKAVLIGDRS